MKNYIRLMRDPSLGMQLGIQAAGTGVGAGLGMLLGAHERKQQIKQQQKLQDMQIAGQKEMGKFNQQQQMEMWEATNYPAQMQQLKKGGLNPGLMYGMSGGGGATANITPGSVSGGQARQGGEAMGMAMQMQQAALLAAQTENIKADTKNKEAGTGKTGVETQLLELQRKLKDKTLAWDTERAFDEWRLIAEQANVQGNIRAVTDQTIGTEVELRKQELTKVGVEIALAEAMKGKTEAEVANIASQIATRVQELANAGEQIAINKQLAEWETSWGKQVAGLLGNIISIIPGMRSKGGKK